MRLLSLRSSLLLLRRRNGSETPHVISVTGPLALTDADSGNTYSLDSLTARLDFPLRATLTNGWTINVQCTVTERFVTATGGEVGVGVFTLGGDPCDGIRLDSLDASATITLNMNHHEVTVNAGEITLYWE